MKVRTYFAALIAVSLLPGCPKKDGEEPNEEPLTLAEAGQAVEEAAISGDAINLVGGSIEITTDFTIGEAVANAAAEIGDFIESQLPCAAITLENATLTVQYGANEGNCTYNGQTYSGTHIVSVEANEENDIVVSHEWQDLSNQRLSVSGFATVTWSLSDQTRRVVHELNWTRLSDGRTGTGSGDRLQGALDGNILNGFTVDGFRQWEGQAGEWDLDINNVEWRWIDPVPQTGSYALTTPNNKSLSLSFERVDDDTIKVTVAGTNRSFDFNVTKAGAVSEQQADS